MSDSTHSTPNSAAAVKLKQIRFRAWHRGTKEMDLVLGHFADAYLDQLEPHDLLEFEALLGLPDQQLTQWILGREPVPERYDTSVWRRIASLDFLPTADDQTEVRFLP